MTKRQIDAKVTPEAMQIMLTDEMTQRLADITGLLQMTIPIGEMGSYIISVTDDRSELDFRTTPRISFSLFNDGPNQVYVATNNATVPNDAPIKVREQYHLDARAKSIWRMRFVCDLGETATVRIKTLR